MKTKLVLLLALALAGGGVYADEQKPEAKKSAAKKSAKAKPAAKKSDQNVFQKAESAVGKAAHDSKIWVHSKNRKN